jgi:hypothetical protein
MEKALSTEHPLLVSTVILHSTVNLFQSEFPGSHVLIPTYIHAIGRILPETGHGAILRNACIRILGCFTCYPEHFARLIFSRNNTTIKKPLVKTYEEVTAAAACRLPHHSSNLLTRRRVRVLRVQMIVPLNAIMLGGVKVESDPGNLQTFLWVASVYANATIDYNTSFCDGFIRAILQKIVTVGNASHAITCATPIVNCRLIDLARVRFCVCAWAGFPGWTDDVMLTCFQILTDLSCVHQFLVEETEDNPGTRPRAGPIRQRLTLGTESISDHATTASQCRLLLSACSSLFRFVLEFVQPLWYPAGDHLVQVLRDPLRRPVCSVAPARGARR